MPTKTTEKLPRISVSFPEDLYQMILRDANDNQRSDSGQIVWIVKQHYAARVQDAKIFTPTELTEEERRKAHFFETKNKHPEVLPKVVQNSSDQKSHL